MNIAELSWFCWKDAGREAIASPWVEMMDGEWYTVATDGRIMIRVPGRLCEERDGHPLAGKVTNWAAVRESVLFWAPVVLPLVRAAETSLCGCCHGSGVCTCRRCEDEHDCGRCKGGGRVTAEPVPVPTPAGVFSALLLQRLDWLPGLQLGVGHSMGPASMQEGTAYFRFDGGDGIVVRLRDAKIEDCDAALELYQWLDDGRG